MLENQFSNDIKGVERDFNFVIYAANIQSIKGSCNRHTINLDAPRVQQSRITKISNRITVYRKT